jgi:hypothetical protein
MLLEVMTISMTTDLLSNGLGCWETSQGRRLVKILPFRLHQDLEPKSTKDKAYPVQGVISNKDRETDGLVDE